MTRASRNTLLSQIQQFAVKSMRSILSLSFIALSAFALGGCATTEPETRESTATDETCYATGSIIPRKDCRNTVNTAKGDDIERVRRAPPPVAAPAPGGAPR
jgi:hypothetical protein